MERTFKYDEQKLKELILYVAAKCDEDPRFGAVKLNKILFFSDFAAYAKFGRPITGAEYRKYPQGPCPSRMKVIKQEMENGREAYEYINPLDDGLRERRLLAWRKPDLGMFSVDEIAIVDEAIRRWWGRTGTDISEVSHQHPGWKLTELKEEIPYFTAFIAEPGSVELDEEESGWLENEAKRLKVA